MQDRVANSLIIGGALAISIGAGMVYMPAGVIVFGVLALYGGIRLAVAK